jgi:quercetin dioxygenase-like cupin family protein
MINHDYVVKEEESMQAEATNRLNPSEETIQVGPMAVKFLVTGDDSNGSVAIFEMSTPSDVQLPAPHSHDAYEETIYGLEGVLTFTVDGTPHDIGPGQSLCIRRGQVHGFANTSGAVSRSLAIVTPALIGPEYFHGVAEIFASGAAMPEIRTRLMELMRRFGLSPAPPRAAS